MCEPLGYQDAQLGAQWPLGPWVIHLVPGSPPGSWSNPGQLGYPGDPQSLGPLLSATSGHKPISEPLSIPKPRLMLRSVARTPSDPFAYRVGTTIVQ